MAEVTREQLHAFLDDSLDEAEETRIEKLLRSSAELRTALSKVREERDRGEHSLGGVWRRERLSCLSREQLSSYLHGILEPDLHAYIDFHMKTIGCSFCLANHLSRVRSHPSSYRPRYLSRYAWGAWCGACIAPNAR